jgi:hypothetical protein
MSEDYKLAIVIVLVLVVAMAAYWYKEDYSANKAGYRSSLNFIGDTANRNSVGSGAAS